MLRRRLRCAAGAVLVAALAAGCGAAAPRRAARAPARHLQQAPPRTDVDADVPVGFRLHRSDEGGVSLALPDGWLALAGRDARYPGVIQTLTRVHAAFLPYLTALAVPDSDLRLFAFDPHSSRVHPSIASVQLVSSGPQGSYGRWSQQALRSLRKLKNLRGALESRRIDLAAGPALRVAFDRSDGDRVLIFVVSARSGLWALTFASLPHAPGNVLFDRAATTLRLFAERGGPQISGGTGGPAS